MPKASHRTFALAGAVLAAALLSAGSLSAQSDPVRKADKTMDKAAAKSAKTMDKAVTKSDKAMDKADKKMDHAMDHGAMDHGKAGDKMGGHMKSGWKELDGYHEFMEATWHPAKGKNDLAPLRAKAGDMAASAKLLATSTPPKHCDTPDMRAAATALSPATTDVAVLAAKKGTDAQLKSALAALHDRFEVLEKGCAPVGAKH